jgi:cytochrome c-type biogenesis protein CcmH
MGAVLVVALVVGTGVLHSSPPTAAQRAASIDSDIRCPSCEDLSVATSSAPTAVTVRTTVRQLVGQGRTDQQIEQYLTARYGTSIVLDPPASGWSLLVWVLPLAGGAVAVAGLAVVLVRRRASVDAVPVTGKQGRSTDPELVEGRRRFLQQSLADADAEYLAGDLSDRDYLALRRRDMAALAQLAATASASAPAATAPATTAAGTGSDEVGTEPAGTTVLVAEPVDPADPDPADGAGPTRSGSATGAPAPPRRRRGRSWWFLGGAVAAFAAALVLSVSLFSTSRQPGESATGSFAQTAQQQIEETLAQAATDENQGELGQAANLYQSVITKHPDNEVALAQLGWLEFETGQQGRSSSLIADGRAKLNRAVQLDPGDYAVRLYLGTVLLQQDGNPVGAVGEYRKFLADSPPAAVLQQAAPELRQAFTEAGLPVPASVPSS